MTNLQYIRYILELDKDLNPYLINLYGKNNYKINYSNFGFIVIPNNEDYIYKYYLSSEYSDLLGINNIKFNFHEKEINNYKVLKNKGFLIPYYEYEGEVCIKSKKFFLSKIENIRKKYKKITSFEEIEPEKLADFFNKLHKDNYIHGNIHPSNFFIDNQKIGLFDLVEYRVGKNIIDLSRILINTDINLIYFNNFLKYYKLDYDISEIYYTAIIELYDILKNNYGDKKDLLKKILVLRNNI